MNGYHEQIASTIDAAVIHSTSSFSWFGRRIEVLPRQLRRDLPPERLRASLILVLRDTLYRQFYLYGWPASVRQGRAMAVAGSRLSFAQALAQANAGSGGWENGWEIVSMSAVEWVIQRDGLTLRVDPAECRSGFGHSLDERATVQLRVPSGLPAIAPGFYTALGDEPFPSEPTGTILRVYWNVAPTGAVPLVAALSRWLNHEQIPFRLKILDDPATYGRVDPAVLYLPAEDWPDAEPILARVHRDQAVTLRQAVPALTLELAPGLGLAEDPGGDESFGMQRCRVLAEGIVRAWEERRRSPRTRMLAVAERFAEAGIAFDAPYLNPGSSAAYPFRATAGRVSRSRGNGAREPLAVASGLGRRIVETAIWAGERCTWLGAQPAAPDAPAGSTTWRTLSPDLYDGTAGVGLVLAELHHAAPEPELRRTALGALRQAVATAGSLPPLTRLGLYTGLPGIALACARAGRLLDDAETLDAARALVDDPGWADPAIPHEHDLLSGSAGAIVGLLSLGELLGDPRPAGLAVELGERLLGAARESAQGLSWGQAANPAAPHLTGLSHGASGVGLALLELWRATGQERFRDAGLRAFAWERQWYAPAEGNWPDFREVRLRAGRPPRRVPYATFWCHGAPGIALARLRGWQLTGDEQLLAEATDALATTQRALARELRPAVLNFSLCHGMAGLAGVLLDGAAALPEQDAGPAREAAALGARLYAAPGATWPCGTHSGETPGLMLGLAGIARFYLRLHDPALPSLLLPAPESFAG